MTETPADREGFGALYAALTNKWDPQTVAAFARTIENGDDAGNAETIAAFQVIDAKASGLLTHVSMMIAGLGICAPMLAQHRFEEVLIVAEIACYLVIAVGCLRCLSVLHSHRKTVAGKVSRLHMQRELIVRHELYRVCINSSIYLTIFVFLSLPFLLWWP
jgi:hypothetical protein